MKYFFMVGAAFAAVMAFSTNSDTAIIISAIFACTSAIILAVEDKK